jgi:D-3-phosphoglycerate dehydrogenase
MAEPTTYVFDFDSTLVRIETLEALADIALAGVPDAAAIRAEVAALTDQAMTGDLPFGEALNRRLALLPLTRDHIAELAGRILDEGTPSVRRNLRFFRENAGRSPTRAPSARACARGRPSRASRKRSPA